MIRLMVEVFEKSRARKYVATKDGGFLNTAWCVVSNIL